MENAMSVIIINKAFEMGKLGREALPPAAGAVLPSFPRRFLRPPDPILEQNRAITTVRACPAYLESRVEVETWMCNFREPHFPYLTLPYRT